MHAQLSMWDAAVETLAPNAVLLRGFASEQAQALWTAVKDIEAQAPFRHMVTRGGFPMSVAMTNCGALGWTSDRRGYRYEPADPLSERPWPAMPPLFLDLALRAAAAAGFANFAPDACLINRYEPGARMGLHQDRDEVDFNQPIVSVSLGLPAVFLWGGETRKDKVNRYPLHSGDVVAWGGPSRIKFHGVAPLDEGIHPITGACRINLTFRKAI